MKVSNCKDCIYYKTGRWVTYHEPLNYHPIGITHRYGYCENYKKRCLDVKKCEFQLTPEQIRKIDEAVFKGFGIPEKVYKEWLDKRSDL